MSTLEHKLTKTTETVFTAEFHSLDGNGLEKAKNMPIVSRVGLMALTQPTILLPMRTHLTLQRR